MFAFFDFGAALGVVESALFVFVQQSNKALATVIRIVHIGLMHREVKFVFGFKGVECGDTCLGLNLVYFLNKCVEFVFFNVELGHAFLIGLFEAGKLLLECGELLGEEAYIRILIYTFFDTERVDGRFGGFSMVINKVLDAINELLGLSLIGQCGGMICFGLGEVYAVGFGFGWLDSIDTIIGYLVLNTKLGDGLAVLGEFLFEFLLVFEQCLMAQVAIFCVFLDEVFFVLDENSLQYSACFFGVFMGVGEGKEFAEIIGVSVEIFLQDRYTP